MKQFGFLLLISILLFSCSGSKDQYTLTGTIRGADTGMVYLQRFTQEKWTPFDSAKMENGSFTFKGKVDMPEMMHLSLQEQQVFLPVFVENAKMEVEIIPDSMDNSRITGSETHDLYTKYVRMNDSINLKMEEIYSAWKKAKDSNDTLAMARYDSISGTLDKAVKEQLVGFVKTNRASVVAPYLVMRNSWQFEEMELVEVVSALDTNLNQSMYMEVLKKRIAILQNVAIGKIAPDFTMNDSTGAPVSLSSFKGKWLLVDFWASWCGPCRAENPNVVKAYQAYSAKGFGILGVSFDQNRDKWLKAVKDDQLTWQHVSDLKGWGNEAGKLYGIVSIPANVLLDQDQKIVARNLRGEDLMNKLAEILGPPVAEKKGKQK